jgi:hypothetical protein
MISTLFMFPHCVPAIERGISPAVWTRSNIADMKQQLKQLGFSFDWSKVRKRRDFSAARTRCASLCRGQIMCGPT